MLTRNTLATGKRSTQYRRPSPTIDAMMREVLQTLGKIDFQHDADMERLGGAALDEKLKVQIRSKLLARHRERRGPYVALLTELRKRQHRLALAA